MSDSQGVPTVPADTPRRRRTGMVVVDSEGTIRLWERDAEALTGHVGGQVIGQSLDVIVPTEYRDRHWTGFRSAMASGTARAEGAGASIPVLCGDGVVRRFPARFTLIRDAFGHPAGAAAVIVEPLPDEPPLFEL